jgi:ketosteroid isomerase-like protein
VFLDHTDEWTFGEKVSHQFCTLHKMRDGKISRWSDYWDVSNFVGQFPAWFLEEMAKSSAADFSD